MFCIPLGSRITTLTSGDKQNETKPSALEVAGRALKGLEPWFLSVSALCGLALWSLTARPWLGSSELGL